jgi:hypothetical protein
MVVSKSLLIFLPVMLFSLAGFAQSGAKKINTMKPEKAACTEPCSENPDASMFSCKLTSPEIQKRKATVIASLKRQVLEKQELTNGYAYRFKGTDEIVDELVDFVKTERLCCSFFDFQIQVAGNGDSAWLTITGPEGARDFIQTELEF